MSEAGTILKGEGEQRAPGRFTQAHKLREQRRVVNISKAEQYGSIIAGGGMLAAGFARRGLGGLVMLSLGALLVRRGFTAHSPLYRRMGMSTAPAIAPGVPDNVGIKVERKITINRSPAEIFAFWRDVRNLPRFMKHLERVSVSTAGARTGSARGRRAAQWNGTQRLSTNTPTS